MNISFLKSIAYKSLVVGIVPLMVACGGGDDNNGSNTGGDGNNGGGNTPAITITSPQENQNFLIGKYSKEEEITHPLTATAEVNNGTGNEELKYKWSVVSTLPAEQENNIVLENDTQQNASYRISRNYDKDVDVTFKVTVSDTHNPALSKDKEITLHLKQPKIQLEVTGVPDDNGYFNETFSIRVILPDYIKDAGYDGVSGVYKNGAGGNIGAMVYFNKESNYTNEIRTPDHAVYRIFYLSSLTSSNVASSNWKDARIFTEKILSEAINGAVDVGVTGDPWE